MSIHTECTLKSNEELVALLCSLSLSKDTTAQTVDLLAQLITKPPTVQFYAKLAPCKWLDYLKTSNAGYSTMHTLLKFVQHKKLPQLIFEAYETNSEVREIIEFLHEQKGNNRVPYLHVLVKNLARLIGQTSLSSKDKVVELLTNKKTLAIVNQHIAENKLKTICGATNTVVGMYDWIASAEDKNIRPDINKIKSAAYCADLGGGFATADISRVLGKQFISHDITNPKELTINLLAKQDTTYLAAVHNTPYKYFDVFETALEKDHKSYAIVSFGFLTSTVTSISSSTNNEKNTISTLLAGLTKIVELANTGVDIYCYFYSRATRRLYQNAVIQLHISNNKINKIVLASRPFSNLSDFMGAAAMIDSNNMGI